MPDNQTNLTPDEEYEQRLRRELDELNAESQKEDEASTAEKPEEEQQPESEASGDVDTQTGEEETDKPGEASESKPSKDDDDAKLPSGTKTVPVQRLSAVTREKRKLERKLRESEKTSTDLRKQNDWMKAQASVKGYEFTDKLESMSIDELSEYADQTDPDTALMVYQLLEQRKANEPAGEDDAHTELNLAIENNELAFEWQTASDEGDGDQWELLKSTWRAIGDDYLNRKFKTWDERLAHVVSETEKVGSSDKAKAKAEKQAAESEKDQKPPRSLNNISGDTTANQSEVEAVLSMANPSEYLTNLEKSRKPEDRAKYTRIRTQLREKTRQDRKSKR